MSTFLKFALWALCSIGCYMIVLGFGWAMAPGLGKLAGIDPVFATNMAFAFGGAAALAAVMPVILARHMVLELIHSLR